MSTASIKIDQAGKSAGISGKSRDDLDLFTGANPIQIASTDGTAVTIAWTLLDKPPSSVATIANPAIATTTFNADVSGSYFLQLSVDGGGSPGQIQRLVAAVQIPLPVWVTGALDAPKLRIPAKGETIEFNVNSSPLTGANTRGWAEEMDEWFRSITQYAFGVAIQALTVPVTGTGYNTFFTINFGSGFSVSDAGGGVLNVTQSGGSAITPANYTVNLPGGPFTVLDIESYFVDPTGSNIYNNLGNSNWEASGGNAQLVVHSGHHQKFHHNPGIYNDGSATLGFAATINTGSNPMTVTFSDLGGTQIATTDGRTTKPGVLGAGPHINLSAPASPRLFDWTVNPGTLQPEATQLIAVAASINIEGLIVDVSTNHPAGTLGLTFSASGWRWAGGRFVPALGAPGVLRLFHADAVNYVDIYQRVTNPSNGTDNWTITAPVQTLQRLGRALYWMNGSTAEWGYSLGGIRRFIDYRQTGFIGETELQPIALARIDQTGADLQMGSGVVFTRCQTNSVTATSDIFADSFGLTATGVAVPNDGSAIEGGHCWISGRRYTLLGTTAITAIPGIGSAGYKVIWVEVSADGKSVSLQSAAATDPINALLLTIVNSVDTQPPFTKDSSGGAPRKKCPLWFGRFDGTNLLGVGRVDLRRDVAYLGEWTVGTRSFYSATSLDSPASHQPLGRTSTVPIDAGALGVEFESIAAALAWHAVLTGGAFATNANNLLVTGGRRECFSSHVKVIRDTFETYPICLWNNCEIRGFGKPNVRLMARSAVTGFGSQPGYLWLGSDSYTDGTGTGNQLAYNIQINGCTFVVNDPTADGQTSAEIMRLYSPAWNSAAFGAITPQSGMQDITIENNRFTVRDDTSSLASTIFAGIRFVGEVGPGGAGNHVGTFHRIAIRKNNLGGDYATRAGSKTCLALGITGSFQIPINGELNQQVEISDNTIRAYSQGIRTVEGATGIDKLEIRDNSIVANGLNGVGIYIGLSDDFAVNRNTISVSDPTGQDGIFIFNGSAGSSNGRIFDNRVNGPAQSTPTGSGIAVGDSLNTRIERNTISGWKFGIAYYAVENCVNNIIRGNNVVNLIANAETFGVWISATIVQYTVIDDNYLTGHRVGIHFPFVTGANVKHVTIKKNTIIGQVQASVPSGSTTVRGIFVGILTALGYDQAINIQDNFVRDCLGQSADSTDPIGAPGGGVVVWANSPQSGILNGLVVDGNEIVMATNTGGSRFLSPEGCWGIYTNLSLMGGSVKNNTISVDDAVIISTSSAGDGGISIGAGVVTAGGSLTTGAAISDNTVTWSSGSHTLLAATAGIRVVGDQSHVKISDNCLLLQSGTDFGGVIWGRLHGIVIDASIANNMFIPVATNDQIINNKIDANVTIVSANAKGSVGCPIWSRFNSVGLRINDNQISGNWHHNPDATTAAAESPRWAGIAVGVDGGTVTTNCQINGNSVVIDDSSAGAGGVNLVAGIRVGGALSSNLGSGANLQINNNLVEVNISISSPNASAESGGIVIGGNGDPGSTFNLQINDNMVNRTEPTTLNVPGIFVHGWCHLEANNNHVLGHGVDDLKDVNVGSSMPVSNRWSLNRFGTPAAPGAATFGSHCVPDPAGGSNWSGVGFI